MSSPLGLTIKTSLNDMQIGDCIPCRYTASTSGSAGYFSELGTSTVSEIPVTGSATPDGLFYFIKTDKGTLIADRVIQTNISWDVLNTAGFIEGNKVYSNNIIPTMTGYSTPSGIASASTDDFIKEGVGPAWGAFGSSMWSAIDNTKTGWLMYKFTQQKIITKYTLKDAGLVTRCPRNWTFEGSNDNVSWTILDTRISQSWTLNIKNEYYINNNVAYIYYRINISANNGDTEYLQIGKFEMMETCINGIIRSLSGGVAYIDTASNSSTTDKSLGGWPPNNEWDTYLVKSDLNGKITPGDDNIWHWKNAYSWTKDSYNSNNVQRILRGITFANYYYPYSSSNLNGSSGFRPMLNYIESDIINEVIY